MGEYKALWENPMGQYRLETLWLVVALLNEACLLPCVPQRV